MSAFVPIPDGADIEIRLTLFDRPLELTLHAIIEAPPQDAFDRSRLATFVDLWFHDQLLPHLSSDLRYRETVVRDATAAGGAESVSTLSTGFGGQALRSYSAMVAAVIAFLPANQSGMRSNRNYIPGLHDGIAGGGRLNPAFVSASIEAYDNLIDIFPLAGWIWVCVHRFSGFTPLAEATISPVIHARYNRLVTGQRRKRVSNTF